MWTRTRTAVDNRRLDVRNLFLIDSPAPPPPFFFTSLLEVACSCHLTMIYIFTQIALSALRRACGLSTKA